MHLFEDWTLRQELGSRAFWALVYENNGAMAARIFVVLTRFG